MLWTCVRTVFSAIPSRSAIAALVDPLDQEFEDVPFAWRELLRSRSLPRAHDVCAPATRAATRCGITTCPSTAASTEVTNRGTGVSFMM